ncbi:protein eyes shut homolog [Pecten maximus]|uniref:protein eyes shut homolog n=1 Tax=Pecten maximus TaxID=6579 RepID=UPI001458B1C6|nr:protein eyes shut homolog [Pecten maximus]
MDSGGISVNTGWGEAAYSCTNADSFPRPVPDTCTFDSSTWFGGFRRLQYVPGSTDGIFCKRLSYAGGNDNPSYREVSCDISLKFYCRFIESGYNETCDVNIHSSCDTRFICSDRGGSPKCLCPEDKYLDNTLGICKKRRTYDQSCDVSAINVCEEQLSCQAVDGAYKCLCNADWYWNPTDYECDKAKSYGQECDVNIAGVCLEIMVCQRLGETYMSFCSCGDQHYLNGETPVCLPGMRLT